MYSKQTNLSSRLPKKQNSKSYLYSNLTDNNSKSKDRKIYMPKSDCGKTIKSKPKDDLGVAKKIIKENIKYPDSKIITNERPTKKNFLFATLALQVYEYSLDKLFLFMKSLLPKETYAQIREKLLEEIQNGLSIFILSRTKSKNFSPDKPFNKNTSSETKSSITELIKEKTDKSLSLLSIDLSRESNLKLSYDFISKKVNENSVKPIIIDGDKDINLSTNYRISKKHSLYSLTKNKMVNNTQSNSKSKSSSREHFSANKNFTVNLRKKNQKPIYNMKASNILLNMKLFKKMRNEANSVEKNKNNSINACGKVMPKRESNSGNKCRNKNSGNTVAALFSNIYLNNQLGSANGNKTTTHSKKKENTRKPENRSEGKNRIKGGSGNFNCTSGNKKTKNDTIVTNKSNTKIGFKKIPKEFSNNVHTYTNNNNNNNCANNIYTKGNAKDPKKKVEKVTTPPQKSEAYHKELNNVSTTIPIVRSVENENDDNKTNEQLREIKLSLDDNLKIMFNFSYEGFLNKDSESESKKSFDDKKSSAVNTNENQSNAQVNNKESSDRFQYTAKYKY